MIIGIVLSLILTAAMAGLRRAEERATQGLISKLETGLDDRLQALLQTQPDYNSAHYYMAQLYAAGLQSHARHCNPRTNVIANYDQIKAELPDVFILSGRHQLSLQLRRPAVPWHPVSRPYSRKRHAVTSCRWERHPRPPGSSAPSPSPARRGPDPYGTGIFGASYTAAAGFYKNLG